MFTPYLPPKTSPRIHLPEPVVVDDLPAVARPPRRRFGKEEDSASASTGMTRDEVGYLTQLFDLMEWGVGLRVMSTRTRLDENSMQTRMQADRGYNALLTRLNGLTPPSQLAVAHQWLIDALALHRDFFDAWDASDGTPDIPASPLVRAASDKLRSVAAALISSFPRASPHNRRAFFDHMGALDFI